VDIAVGWAIEFGGVALEWVRTPLLDVDRHGRSQALRAEDVEAQRAPVRVGEQWKPVLGASLVAGDQGWTVLDRRVRAGEMGDAWFWGHAQFLLCVGPKASRAARAKFPCEQRADAGRA